MSLLQVRKLFLIGFLAFVLFQGRIVLAEQVGLSVDQTVFSFTLNPGEEKAFVINAKNISKETEQVSIRPQDFSFGENNRIEALLPKNELNGMSEWITVGEEKMILKSDENKELTFSIKVPKDTSVGSHFALVSLQALPQINGQNFQSTLTGGQVGVYVLVNVAGKASGSGSINTFEAPIITDKQAILKTEFENTGNVHYIPHGEVHIQNIITRQSENIEIEKHFVFPGKKYLFELTWDKASSFGMYYAEDFFVDGNNITHTSSRFFFGKFFFVIVIGVVGILFMLYMWKKKISMSLKNIKNK
ncbi:MAG: hypothetical protein WCG73_02065 [Candidatus Moraniibacteriota bacterium]